MMLESFKACCPSCWETIELTIDPSGGDQDYTEDCFVCCRPMIVSVTVMADSFNVQVRAEQDC